MPSLRLGIMAAVLYAAIIAVATVYIFVVWRRRRLTLRTALLLSGSRSTDCGPFLRRHGHALCELAFCRVWAVAVVRYALVSAKLGDPCRDGRRDRGCAHSAGYRGFAGSCGVTALLLTTLLIAFGEEAVFRGILLRGAMTRLRVPFCDVSQRLVVWPFPSGEPTCGAGRVRNISASSLCVSGRVLFLPR